MYCNSTKAGRSKLKLTFMRTNYWGARSRDYTYRARKPTKWTNLNRYMSVSTDIEEKRFVAFVHTIDYHYYGYIMFIYPDLGASLFFCVGDLFLNR